MREQWKTVVTPKGTAYQISSKGRVRNKRTKHLLAIKDDGYVNLSGRNYRVRRLVFERHVGELFRDETVLLIDPRKGVRSDNLYKVPTWQFRMQQTKKMLDGLARWKAEQNTQPEPKPAPEPEPDNRDHIQKQIDTRPAAVEAARLRSRDEARAKRRELDIKVHNIRRRREAEKRRGRKSIMICDGSREEALA